MKWVRVSNYDVHCAGTCLSLWTVGKQLPHTRPSSRRDISSLTRSLMVRFRCLNESFEILFVSGRFLVHDREDEKMELFVTKNFGETFSHAGDYIKSFYFDHREVAALHQEPNYEVLFKDSTLLYVSRMEPSGKLNVLSSSSFFERQIDTRVVFTGANQFEMKDGFLFAVTEREVKEGKADRQLHVARPGERFLFPK